MSKLISAKRMQSLVASNKPRSLVSDNRSIEKGCSSNFVADCIGKILESAITGGSSIADEFEVILKAASALTEVVNREIVLRGLRVFLFGGLDRETEERIPGVFSHAGMVELFEDDTVSLLDFETIQSIWDEFEFPTNSGRFAPIGECFIAGDFPMEPIAPRIKQIDHLTGGDVWIPTTWTAYSDSFAHRDQAANEEPENNLLTKFKLNDLANQVVRAMAH